MIIPKSVLDDGSAPWRLALIDEVVLAVGPWSLDFRPSPQALPRAVLWLRLPDLPPYLWSRAALELIVAKLGSLIQLDDSTEKLSKGRYARVAVDIDLSKPLLPVFSLGITMGKMEKNSAQDMPDVPSGKLPEHLELQRTRVVCKSEGIHYSGAYAAMGVDNSLQPHILCSNFKVEVNRLTEDEIEFDIIGIDASLANAFQRILIAEIPTMAIEKVLVANNTSVIADEVLKADPRLFEYLSENDVPNERNTIVFKLDVSCEKGGPRHTVKSEQLKWLPNGSELLMASHTPSAKPKGYTSFSCSQDSLSEFSKNPPGVKHGDIII